MKILILGVNGFIGNALVARILETTGWEVWGMDLTDCKLGESLDNPRFHFVEGDIGIHREWVEYHVKKCDVVIPLVAIATPASYVRDPLRVFELDFEENLRIVRLCHQYHKRIVFASTSEVYGMCRDESFDEDESPLVYGPIGKSRWIYAASKQLLDRVIAAYGEKEGLQYTCFRPFNWVGPKLDDLDAAKEGSSRVVTQFIERLIDGLPLQIVDGGAQKRCYTWLGDGIDGLMAILANVDGVCDGQIFNLGNPDNECTVLELAKKLARQYESSESQSPGFVTPRFESVGAQRYYGEGYQDIVSRKPSIDKARRLLGWEPRVGLDECLSRTLEAFLADLPDASTAPLASASGL